MNQIRNILFQITINETFSNVVLNNGRYFVEGNKAMLKKADERKKSFPFPFLQKNDGN